MAQKEILHIQRDPRTLYLALVMPVLLLFIFGYGVSFDLEPFAWSAAARIGLTQFLGDLRTALDVIDPTLEISIYGDPTPSSTQWDIPGMEPNLDYLLYSCYDYASSNTAHAISDFNNYINSINDFYIDGGLPPEKMVAVISSYSRRWDGITAYNAVGTNPSSSTSTSTWVYL